MSNPTDLIFFIIFWATGSVVALLGNKRIREYRDYYHPWVFLIGEIIFSVLMSWVFVILSLTDYTFKLPKWLYHNCRDNSTVYYEEEFLDADGNKVSRSECVVYHLYRVYTCDICGKVKKEMLR